MTEPDVEQSIKHQASVRVASSSTRAPVYGCALSEVGGLVERLRAAGVPDHAVVTLSGELMTATWTGI